MKVSVHHQITRQFLHSDTSKTSLTLRNERISFFSPNSFYWRKLSSLGRISNSDCYWCKTCNNSHVIHVWKISCGRGLRVNQAFSLSFIARVQCMGVKCCSNNGTSLAENLYPTLALIFFSFFFSLNPSNLNKTVILHYSSAEVYELNSRPRCKLHFYFFNYSNIFFLAQNQSKNHELSKSMIEQYSCRWGLTRIIDINIDSSRSLIWFLGTDFIDYK